VDEAASAKAAHAKKVAEAEKKVKADELAERIKSYAFLLLRQYNGEACG
jgi:hypothetical protein